MESMEHKTLWANRRDTYLSPERSLPTMLMTAILNTKLEKMVKTAAIPVTKPRNQLLVVDTGLCC